MAERRKRKGERPDGLIQRSLQVGIRPDGKPDRKYFYGHTAAEAERKRDAYAESIRIGCKFERNITLAEWVEQYIATYRTNVDDAYINNDDVPYKRLVDKLGMIPVVEIMESDLQAALNDTAGMSFSSVEKYRQAIKRVFKKARKNKIISDNPAEDLQLPKFTKGTHRALEQWEIDAILANWNHPAIRSGLWVLLMLFCGLRRGELIALRWENIDLDKRSVSVCETAVIKTNQSKIEQRAKTDAGIRVLPICNILFDALSSVPPEKRTGLVCTSAHGLQLSEKSFSCGIKNFCCIVERSLNGEPPKQPGRRTDLEEDDADRIIFSFRSHDLRHTYATMLYNAGVDVKSAAYLLGHADIRVTMGIYTHLSTQKRDEAFNIVKNDLLLQRL